MRTLHSALLAAIAARGVLAGGQNPLLVPGQRDEAGKYGKRKVARAVYARQETESALLHSSHASSHSSHSGAHSSHSSHAHSSHSSHSAGSSHSPGSSQAHSSHSIHAHSSHSIHSMHSAHSAGSSRASRSSHSVHSSRASGSHSSPSSASPSWEASSVEEFSATITAAPTSVYSLPVFDGGSSVVEKDILDNDYNAFTDDQIWATVTGFPPQNSKARTLVAAGFGESGSSGPGQTASSSWASSTASSSWEADSTALEKRAARPHLLQKPTTTRKSTTTKAAPIVTTKYATSYLALGTGTCPTFVGGTKVAQTTGSSSWPAPSRSSVSCRPAPSTFAGTSQGFADLCSGVRYCDPPATQKYTTSSLTGDVTRTEIESLLGQLQNVGSVLQVGISTNTFSTGWAGQGAYGSGLLFEVTGDIRALDNAIRIADNILAMRNDPKTGRVMWTGKRELVWITKPAGTTGQLYAGSENMSIIGNMVNAAIYILRNPCLWEKKPQWTNAPTTFTRSSTYLDRARAYVAAADETMDSYFRPYWFNSGGIMIQPNSSLYSKAQDFPPGTYVPWNRRALMLHGLIRLATAHEIAPLQDPARVKRYDDLAAANVRDFVNNLLPTRSRGYQTYVWYYGKGSTRGTIEMVRGVHGFYDVWGAWIAWQRGLAPETLTNTVMQNLANTMQHAIYSENSDKLFAAYVNGYANVCNADEQPIKYVWGAYAFFGRWIPSWYTQVAQAGQAQLKLTWVTAPLFWAKAANWRNSDAFWRATSYT